jgi:hypothetical protein
LGLLRRVDEPHDVLGTWLPAETVGPSPQAPAPKRGRPRSRLDRRNRRRSESLGIVDGDTHVIKGEINVNIELVRRGAASVWFDGGERGRYAWQLLDDARRAEETRRGLLGACPGTRLDPEHGVETG